MIEKIDNSWWHETIRLYAASSDTTNLIRAALEQPSVMSLTIAYDCLEEGKSVVPEVRQQLEEVSLESSDPEIASLAAQVKLAQRLTKLLRIDESVQIDRRYITFAEYQLFVNEQSTSEEHFQVGNARKPITGINWENALGFCAWLNSKIPSKSVENGSNESFYYYRLPTSTEVQNHPAQEYKRLESWTLGGSNLKEKGIRVVKEQIPLQYTKLASYLAAEEWEKADRETVSVLLQMSNRGTEGELDAESIETLPCSCLRTVDQLWAHYSKGRFGLGMQASIWKSVRGHQETNYEGFGETVGWYDRSRNRWCRNEEITFQRDTPPGHLPCLWCLGSPESSRVIFSALTQRFVACGIERSLPLFEFDVVTVNAQGQEIQQEICRARYFTEDLGNGITLEIVSIPGGKFMMGSPKGKGGDSEYPQHEVIVQPFFMARFQVTQAQWKAVSSLPKVNHDLESNPSLFQGDDRPVEQVSWEDAVEFCQRLSKQTGKEYRLPSEAEWEYAARAGTTTPYHFGETITDKLTNYSRNVSETTTVGKYPPNAFGLYDLHGNVWEWCEDDWHQNYQGAPTDGSAWVSKSSNMKVIRGGSWCDDRVFCRSAFRLTFTRDDRNLYFGFRVVCVAARTT